jgi:hypothetical protein
MDYDPTTFGQRFAEVYDGGSERADTPVTVEFLAALASEGPALELAVGTGRVTLPLAARGLRVDGIEASPEMVAKLRAKPGGDRLDITIGDMADVAVEGSYPLIYLVFNTLFNLTTQDEQVRCFENVAAHLTDDGVFVIEAFVPDRHRVHDDQYVVAETVTADEVGIGVCRHDAVAQRLDINHVTLTDGNVRLYPVVLRYAWPSEIDLMARVAGLRLTQRWGGWQHEPFTASSTSHVSVYAKRAT